MCYWTKSHDGDPQCLHEFKTTGAIILTYPGRIHWECVKCGRRECIEEGKTPGIANPD